MASRVFQFLPDDIKDFPEYVLAGAFFPDAFYNCGNNPNASEYAHWPPFLAHGVDYYNDHYSGNSNSDQRTLKAFLYGIFTHQVTDSSWHSIRLEQGLLKMLTVMDFDQDINDAHSFLDTGGDFLHLLKLHDYSLFNTQWKYPINDVLNIFERVGIPMSATMVKYCVSSGQAALLAEKTILNRVGPVYAQSSPLLDDILENYYLGGLQEISSSIVKCLPNLGLWFKYGASRDPWSLCGAIISPSVTSKNEIQVRDGTYLTPFTPLSNFGSSISIGNFINNELALAVGAPNEDQVGSVYVIPLSEIEANKMGTTMVLHGSSRVDFHLPKRFGSAVTSYKLLGQDFIIVTEPGTSNIYLYSGNIKLVTISDFTARSDYGSNGRKQEAISIEIFDFDGDSIPDIVVGSPLSDDSRVPQRGTIQILSGKLLSLILMNSRFGHEIDIHSIQFQEIHLPKLYQLKEGYEQFGAQTSVNKDYIFTSSNGLGIVFALSRSSGEVKHTIFKDKIDGLPIARQTSKESHRFGSNYIMNVEIEGVELLIVSAHRYTEGSCIGCGAVFVYTLVNSDIKFLTKLTLDISRKHMLSKFGFAALVSNGKLYISAPGYLTSGAIFRISLSEILHSHKEHIVVKSIAFQNEADEYTGFGEALAVSTDQGKLIVGSPNYGFQPPVHDDNKLTGNVIIYNI